jgi:hypothetical protein
MTPTQREHLYKLIDEACTNKQVRSLLRRKKLDNNKVRVSGSSAELLRHLREAHGQGMVSDSDLIGLLAAGEENGRQHIFFYRVMPQAQSRYKDTDSLRQDLIRETEANAARLPHFVLEPSHRTLSDVRLESLPSTNSNLIVKWYSGRQYEHVVHQEAFQRHGEQFIRREIKIEQTRLVSVARFLPRGLLEIRVPAGLRESRKVCLGEIAEVWQILSPVLNPDHFLPLSLAKAMRWLVENNGKKGMKHRVSVAQAADGDARAEFNPAMEGEDLFASHRHREAMKEYEDFAQMDVYWQSPLAAEDQEDEIRCQMGLYQSHGVRIGSKRAAEEIDFVVNRLWELSK